MSLILDALRKSDVERSRQQAPQVAGAGTAAAAAPERRWLVPVLALLTVNAALLGWVLLRPSDGLSETTVATGDTTAATIEPAAPVTVTEPPATRRESPPPAKAVVESLAEASAATGRSRAGAPTPARAPVSAAPETAPRTIEPATTVADAAPIELPDALSLVDDGTLAADALNMELHYYADAADRRFAFIGGRKVADGDTLGSGLRVAEIVRNGVVLEYRGRRYLLRRD